MNIRVLGCSGGIGKGLHTTSLQIDDDIMIDAGTGLGDLDLEAMGRIKHIFVTHSHLDHVCFIPLLIDTIFDRVEEPVVIHGQEATLQALQAYIFNWVVWPDFAELPRPDRAVLSYKVMSPGDTVEINGRKIEMIPVNHIVPAVGYRVESGTGAAFAFSGDTSTNDTFWTALNAHDRLDLLFVESAFSDKDRKISELAKHYCPATLSADLAKLRHQSDIYLTHRKPGDEGRILQEVHEHTGNRSIQALAGGELFTL
ncbi:MAG: 3',5'-cyclic-nucleotide phosphodiesterase [Granulosicoccaceae bacterium]|jgi:ribonuclease BN (tRNA processing enzyme)